MAPTDARYLDMTDEGILLEYEMSLAADGKSIKECPKCGYKTHREKCPVCPDINLSGDMVMDDAFARIEAGEEVDLEKLLRGEQWEPVQKEGGE